ncbi:MAG TPA: helix-turn-helix domain-containing protein [Methylomirabilota bacterium]|nr:helix-turn-helix domain-containing protein [Methylomirabilota bacterium]
MAKPTHETPKSESTASEAKVTAAKPAYIDKIEQAADLQITVRTLEDWMRRRLIPYYKIGKTVRFNPEVVRQSLDEKFKFAAR